MTNYKERLNKQIKERKEQNISIDDITCLYSDFTSKRLERYNYIWKEKIKPFARKYCLKRKSKDDFDKKLFSKVIFNNLYDIRQYKDDKVSPYWNEESDLYKYYASHQYIRHELEHLTIDDIMLLSWELAKTIK